MKQEVFSPLTVFTRKIEALDFFVDVIAVEALRDD